jgi:hypothetical protein
MPESFGRNGPATTFPWLRVASHKNHRPDRQVSTSNAVVIRDACHPPGPGDPARAWAFRNDGDKEYLPNRGVVPADDSPGKK